LIVLLCGCAGAPSREGAYVQALREEYRALGRIQLVLSWYAGTQGTASLDRSVHVGHDRLFQRTALDAVTQAQWRATGNDALALTFLKQALASESVGQATVKFDDAEADAETAATVKLPWLDQPTAFRDADNLIALESDPARRKLVAEAVNAVRASTLNPILEQKEAAAQKAAREAGFADYVALAEEERQVKLEPLLASGIDYLKATESTFRATLDRVAREELGVPREQMRRADWRRLWKSQRLAPYFERSLELKALQAFLSGMGLDLATAAGTEVKVDDSLRPLKRPCVRHAGGPARRRAALGEARRRARRLLDALPRGRPRGALRECHRVALRASLHGVWRADRGVRRAVPLRLRRPALAFALPGVLADQRKAGAGRRGAGGHLEEDRAVRDVLAAPGRVRKDRLRAPAARAGASGDRAQPPASS
jgi:hypothetical protein